MKYFHWLTGLALVLSLALSACGDTATPTAVVSSSSTSLTTTAAATTIAASTSSATTGPVAGATQYPLTITDMTGATITIPKKPERIVCASDQCLDILLELGLKPVAYPGYLLSYPSFYLADPQLYGKDVSSFAQITNNGTNFNAEDIVKAKPDLIIGLSVSSNLRDALKNVAPLYLTQVIGLQSILDADRAVGVMTDRQVQAEAAIKKFQDHLAAYKAKSPNNRSSVLLAGYNTEQALTTKSAAGELLSNLTPYPWQIDNPTASGWGKISLEKLLQVDPDTMLMGTTNVSKKSDAEALAKLSDNSFWKELKAVKNKQIFEVDAQYLLGRGTIALTRLL